MDHSSATLQDLPQSQTEFQDIKIKPASYPNHSTDSSSIQQRLSVNVTENGGRDNIGDSNNIMDHDMNRIKEDTMSLSEKLRTHYREGSPDGSKAKTFSRGLFQFHMLTFSFMAFVYLLPWALEEYGSFTSFIINIACIYIVIMCQSNWLLSIITESDLPANIPDLPPQSSEMDQSSLHILNINVAKPSEQSNTGIHSPTITLPRVDRYGMVWKFCHDCNRFRPPRTHHCKFCRKCILRRDHHCHMVGNCIGHYNQRFFVVLCFYLLLASSIGFPITVSYLASHLQEAESWTWYILPYTFILFLFRYISWKMILLTFHVYLIFIFGILSLFYWLSQLSLISMGKTLVEVVKQMDVKVTSSLSDNFSVVFGNNWFLSFILPVPTFIQQKHDGIWYENVTIYGKKVEDI